MTRSLDPSEEREQKLEITQAHKAKAAGTHLYSYKPDGQRPIVVSLTDEQALRRIENGLALKPL